MDILTRCNMEELRGLRASDSGWGSQRFWMSLKDEQEKLLCDRGALAMCTLLGDFNHGAHMVLERERERENKGGFFWEERERRVVYCMLFW